jgi:hypothetical protein
MGNGNISFTVNFDFTFKYNCFNKTDGVFLFTSTATLPGGSESHTVSHDYIIKHSSYYLLTEDYFIRK